MNVKHKANRTRENEQHNNRYTQSSNYESTPALNKGWQSISLNKENNQNANNFYQASREDNKFGCFEVVKSLEFPKRLRTSVNDLDLGQFKKNKNKHQQEGLVNSQQFVRFRQKQTTQPQEEEQYRGEHLTFGTVGKTGLLTSRQFLEDKRMKNEVIDEILANNKRGMCKSFNEFNIGVGHCVNHPTKKAKYRLLAELSQGQQEMFYCSKCAINLLQQNFKIQEIKGDEIENQNSSLRLQQITKFELRLKGLEQRARSEAEKNYMKDELNLIDEEIMNSNNTFDRIAQLLEKTRKEWTMELNSLRLKKQNYQQARKKEVLDMIGSMSDIQQEIKQYKNMKKFAVMKQNEFQFITASLNNKLCKFQEHLQKTKIPSPCDRLSTHSLSELQIMDKMREEVISLRENANRPRRQRQITFSRRTEPHERMSDDEFTCEELKRPFRVLFPSEEFDQSHMMQGEVEKSKMLSSVRERPTYDRMH